MSLTETQRLYQKYNLPRRHIRLLTLDPDCARDPAPLKGSLKTVSLDNGPVYDALSYVWGPDKDNPTCSIICSGTRLPITQNCHDALRNLIKSHGLRSVWIDAICINQQDNEEKSHQIPLMLDIYGRAARVLIWLGNKTPESDVAIYWVKYASSGNWPYSSIRMKGFPGMMWPPELLKLIKLVPDHLAKIRLRIASGPGYSPTAMADLVGREWFTRVWTIQELVMASDPVVICGDKSVRWQDFNMAITKAYWKQKGYSSNLSLTEALRAVVTVQSFWIDLFSKTTSEAQVRTWMRRTSFHGTIFHRFLDILETEYIRRFRCVQKFIIIAITAQWILTNERPFVSVNPPKRLWFLAMVFSQIFIALMTPAVGSIRQGERRAWEQQFRGRLPLVLNFLRSKDATDHRDKVFALHGVFTELGFKLPPPDWKKSLEQVYAEFTCEFLGWHETLELLKEVSHDKLNNVPSWVPDLRKPHHRISHVNYHATKDSKPAFTITESIHGSVGSMKIKTRATIIAKISYCCPPLEPIPNNEDSLSSTSRAFLNSMTAILESLKLSMQPQFHPSPFDAGEHRARTIFQLFHTGTNVTKQYTSRSLEKFQRWLKVMKMYIPSEGQSTSSREKLVEDCACFIIQDKELTLTTIESYATPQTLFVGIPSQAAIPDTTSSSAANQEDSIQTKERRERLGRLGTAPPHARVGDVVALIKGLNVPFVLREVVTARSDDDDNGGDLEENGEKGRGRMIYEVIGACYFDGAMQGEEWPKDEDRLQDISLV